MRVGTIFNRRFRIERTLGQGGMGHVYAALHLELEQLVAIKLLLPGREAEQRSTQRLLREARAAARIRSEHVVRVLDVVSGSDVPPYIVMEYLEGEDLATRLRRSGPLGVAEAVALLAQAAEAVGEAHRLGIIHRDLKPSNLFLLRRFGRADFLKVLDFGISKTDDREDTLTHSHALLGSPVYASPEQLRSSHDVDRRTDIWSFGVMLYECTSGTRPFNGQTLAQVCTQILQETPPPPSALAADLATAFSSVVMRCLEKDPRARFQNVEELVAALHDYAPAATERCLAYLHDLPAPSLAPASSEVPPAAVERGATLTESVRYYTEQSAEAAKPRRSGLRVVVWASAIAAVVVGAWLLGRASAGRALQTVSAAAGTVPWPSATSEPAGVPNATTSSTSVASAGGRALTASPSVAAESVASARRTQPVAKTIGTKPAPTAPRPWVESR
ncbi:MAG TPA: protein kinase [Polyangiaceae bacterium]|nr:protein kinase [Polyangiaceae bacterium]